MTSHPSKEQWKNWGKQEPSAPKMIIGVLFVWGFVFCALVGGIVFLVLQHH